MTLVVSWRSAPLAGDLAGLDRQMACRQSRDVRSDVREFIGVVLAAGIRPCSGVIILLVFSLSQGLFFAGIAGALAMALGTSITTGTLASLAVFARNMVGRLARVHGPAGGLLISGVELLAAAFVLMLDLVLFAGVWTGGIPGFLD